MDSEFMLLHSICASLQTYKNFFFSISKQFIGLVLSQHIFDAVSHCSMCICPLINRLINCHILSLSFRYLRIFLLRKYSILSFGISPSVCSFLAIFTNRNAITAIIFFCYSVSIKLFPTANPFSCYCYFILSQTSNRSCNKFSSFISLRC